MSIPKVSVLISVYNSDDYVRQAIDSILAQTYTDFEFVVVDDASTDRTLEILRSYRDPRIVLVKNEQNLGLARSLNQGIQISRGEYIARQDADDLSHPQRLAKQVSFLDAHPEVGVVGSAARWVDESLNTLKIWPPAADNAGIQETLLGYCCLIHGSTMYRRQAIQEWDGYDPVMHTGQDYDLWLRVSETWDLACLSDVLYVYRLHKGMASVTRPEEQTGNAERGRARAIQRRLSYAQWALGLGRDSIPPRLRAMGRRKIAQRYVRWSAGARQLSRRLALQFLGIALLLDPITPDVWAYMCDILARKTGLRTR